MALQDVLAEGRRRYVDARPKVEIIITQERLILGLGDLERAPRLSGTLPWGVATATTIVSAFQAPDPLWQVGYGVAGVFLLSSAGTL